MGYTVNQVDFSVTETCMHHDHILDRLCCARSPGDRDSAVIFLVVSQDGLILYTYIIGSLVWMAHQTRTLLPKLAKEERHRSGHW